jgi:FlaA1/EpsC-like NDP-sugar epimerase
MKKFWLSRREVLVLSLDLALVCASYYLAFLVRLDAVLTPEEKAAFWKSLPLVLFFRFSAFFYFGTFRSIWKYISVNDLKLIIYSITSSSIFIIASVGVLFHFQHFPRSVFFIDWLLLIILIGGIRFSKRLLSELTSGPVPSETSKNLLLVGAGDAGELIIREIKNNPRVGYTPIGFVDDDKTKLGRRIHGIPILGTSDDIQKIVAKRDIQEILITIPSARGETIRKIIEKCRATGVSFKILPGIGNLLDGNVSVSQIREIDENDLLGREPIELDVQTVSQEIQGKRILVTGAGGSIGSELCRQILSLDPAQLILYERGENNLYHIELELKEKFPRANLEIVIGDILDQSHLEEIFSRVKPQLVFHAAAYKHVPMMEANPLEALKNNVIGTKNIARAADKYQAEKTIMISTDKAVRPVNVMGASKRSAEAYTQAFNQKSRTRFVTVRFGNVLNSEGSVIPLFKKQIQKGGPVTVTHPEVYRYFMTIPEATQLVLQAGAMGKGGEIFLLEMGKPVRILDLAIDLITLSGLKPWSDIEIVFTGLRPGEKLYEELLIEGEGILPTYHKKIMIAKSLEVSWEKINSEIQLLEEIVTQNNVEESRRWLKRVVPEYSPEKAGYPSPESTERFRIINFEGKKINTKKN